MSPDHRRHRGAHPEDAALFAPHQLPALRLAVSELSWLLQRGYAWRSALKLVGDRHRLTERQRLAVARAACSDEQRRLRAATRLPGPALTGREVSIDGFNLIITLEAALGGGVLLRCRDGCLRDLSSVHGSYRSVLETDRAIRLAGEALAPHHPRSVTWLLDQPVSNSGRLAARIREAAQASHWPWSVQVVMSPDAVLRSASNPVVTSDSAILDQGVEWVNLAAEILAGLLPLNNLLDLQVD